MWSYLTSRVQFDPKVDPVAFLEALPDAIDATYVLASGVHEDGQCPFPLGVSEHVHPNGY